MDVDESGGIFPGYELKLNSYDIGVDIELNDAIQRLRFEHPEVKTVIMTSAKWNMFCAGANIRMLGGAAHGHKVNFCKFTNETRNGIEDASAFSGQRYLCALNGTAAGGGYELALACDYLILIDDSNAAVSLPEVPLLAVLPGTGGLTRVTDKRMVRRDHADIFCTLEEGIRGQRAVDWRLVDEAVPGSRFADRVETRAQEMAATSDRPAAAPGIHLNPLQRRITASEMHYASLNVTIDRTKANATLTLHGPVQAAPADIEAAIALGDGWWLLRICRELDNALLHLRFNEPGIGTLILKTAGDVEIVGAHDDFLNRHADHWLLREIRLYWKRTLKRLDLTSRTIFAFVEPGSCFAGVLAELLFAADRTYMLEGQFADAEYPAPPATILMTDSSFGPCPMSNGISRLETRFLGEPHSYQQARTLIGQPLDARQAEAAGLVTVVMDDLDWPDEIRMLLEERASFSPDALTGMEANLRFAGPETMETKIFGRLTAWQNWIFQRPNAVGDQGALKLYGTGSKPEYDKTRV
ncbi:MAG: benzoyl-CoA-dihydrodiol lyase [Gammaproteobacteria bacterium]|nr:benzoyl-CoA-dihydrodiol lyase [Gammaproteobacteria bacterium]